MNLLRAFIRGLNHSRPWWWRFLARWSNLPRLGWAISGTGHRVHIPGHHLWLDVTLHGAGHTVEVDPTAQLRGVTLDIRGQGHKVYIGPGCVLNHVYLRIRGEGNEVHLEEGVRFTRGGEIWLEDQGSRLHIGPRTTVVQAHLAVIEGTTLRIGAEAMLAYDIEIRTGDSHVVLDAQTGQRLNPSADVRIDDHVWIGAHARLLKGVHIGRDSVVASSAVVTEAHGEEGVIWAGVPARILRRGITWRRERTG